MSSDRRLRPHAGLARLAAVALVFGVVAAACNSSDTDGTETDSTTTSTTLGTPTSAVVTSTSGDAQAVTSTSGVPQEDPRRGGSAVVGLGFVPTSLNELRAAGFASERWLRHLVRPAGYVIAPDGGRVPHLVVADPTPDDGSLFVAEDGSLEVTWNIDPAARWSDGVRIAAADFAVFHEADCPEVDRPVFTGEFLDADPGQVRVRFPQQTAAFREAVAHVIPAHAIDRDVVCFDDGMTWPATGPFVVASNGGPMLELERNPMYWRRDPVTDERLPYLDAISFREVTDDPAGLLSTGAVDVVDGAGFVGVGAVPLPSGTALVQGSGPVWEFLTFQFGRDNRNAESLNRHLEFRQALVHALDRVALAEEVGWVPSDGLGGAATAGLWAVYDNDPEESAALLEDLCIELERDCVAEPPRVVFSTTSNASERPRIAELVAQAWRSVGVDVELQLEDSALFFGESAPRGTYDIGMWAWLVGPADVDRSDVLGTFDPSDPGPEGRNWYRWGTPGSAEHGGGADELAALLGQLDSALDAATLDDLLRAAEQILADEVVVIPIGTRPVVVVHSLTLVGPEPSAAPAGFLWNAEFWSRSES